MVDTTKALTPQEQLPPQPMLISQNILSKTSTSGFHTQPRLVEDSMLIAQDKFQETKTSFFMQNETITSNQKKAPSPTALLQPDVLKIAEAENGAFTMNQVIATSGEAQRVGHSQQRGSKQKKNLISNGEGTKSHTRVTSNPSKPASTEGVYNTPNMTTADQFQAFNMFHPSQMPQAPYAAFSQTQQHPMMQQPPQQVHFIAKQQKFYQISPSRAAEAGVAVGSVPILIDKRPYTSSSVQQVMNKRQSGNKVQNQAIAALYLANSKTNQAHSKPQEVFQHQGSLLQGTPYQPTRKRMSQNLSVPRKATNNQNPQVFTQIDHEQLFEEAIKLKQNNYDLREESGRLKARIKMQETELQRKDKQIEDFYQQNQFIQNAQKTGSQLAPIAQQTQKYQQETFLLMSLKKQVKQLKSELQKREDQVQSLLKVGKVAKFSELEQELEIYKEKVIRLQLLQSQQKSFEFNVETGSETKLPQSQVTQQELSCSESNQAQIMVQGNQPSQSVELLANQEHFEEVISQRDSVIVELQKQLSGEAIKFKKASKEATDKQIEIQKQFKNAQLQQTQLETKLKESETQIKFLNSKILSSKDASKLRDDKLQENTQLLATSEKKNKSLKETLSKVQVSAPQGKPAQASKLVESQVKFVAPILATYLKIVDRLALANEMKHGIALYKPSKEVATFVSEALVHEVALLMPDLKLPKARLDSFIGDASEKVKCDFIGETMKGEPLTLQQRQFLMAKFLVEIQGQDIYINADKVLDELDNVQLQDKRTGKHKQVSEEEMLDIAEMCFIKMADVLIKLGATVREAFGKYAIPEMISESKTILELLVPEAFFEAIKVDLRITDLTDLEAACLMRVLAKPELDNAIILNEFALILENFGVPLIDGTISDEEDFIPDGQDKPADYDLKNIDLEGLLLMQDVAKFLLKEYMHPREFFGKMVKNNQEVKTEKRSFRVDIINVKDFYLKIKIANIRKNLQENQSLNKELCLDSVAHPNVFNMKTFVRALEDIAEVEQEKLMEIEKAMEDSKQQEGIALSEKPFVTMTSALAPMPSVDQLILQESKEPTADYADLMKSNTEIKPEVVSFGKGRKSRRSPKPQSKFQALGTIEESINETATSMQHSIKDDESQKKVSNYLRDSHRTDLDESGGASDHKDSMQRVDLLNRSLSGRDDQRNEFGRSMKSDHHGDPQSTEHLISEEMSIKSDKLDNLTPDIRLPAQETEDEYDDTF